MRTRLLLALTLALAALLTGRGRTQDLAARPSARDVAGAREELAALESRLRELESDPDWPDCQGDLTEISLRLALFDERFGLRADQCEEWSLLRPPASMLLGRVRAEIARFPGALDIGLGLACCPLRWDLAVLLDLCGDGAGAHAVLFTPLDDIPADHWTAPFYVDDDRSDLARLRAEFLVRRGDHEHALEVLMDGMLWPSGCTSRIEEHLLLVLAARLEDLAGQPEIAHLLRRSAAASPSDDVGARLARAALGTNDATADVRVVQLSFGVSASGPPWHRSEMACAVGEVGRPESWRLLALRVPVSDDNRADALRTEWRPERLLEARDYLLSMTTRGHFMQRFDALLALHALDRSSRPLLAGVFEELSGADEDGFASGTITHADFAARQICGDGPLIVSRGHVSTRWFSRDWLKWLDRTPSLDPAPDH